VKIGSNKSEAAPGHTARITPVFRPAQVEKAAPCQAGCANCGDIRGWIGKVAQRKKTGITRDEAFSQAWRVIAEVNPFPATLGRICPHPCEKDCNRSDLDEPLSINAMERFLGDHAIQNGLALPRLQGPEMTEWVGVIGAGPSGLSFAYQMSRRGYRVSVYDAREKAGGMLRYGVPDFRLPQEVLDAEIEKILDLGIELELNCKIGVDVSLADLHARHDCLYLGVGAQKGCDLSIPGADGPSVLTGSEYLRRINCGEKVNLGERVIVVGGGNTAVDAARCARRAGSEVTIIYRRSREEMPAFPGEIEEAIEEGVQLMLLAAPAKIERIEDGKLIGVQLCRMALGKLDTSGRRRPVPVSGTECWLTADSVITAVSQIPALEGLESAEHKGDWLLGHPEDSRSDVLLAGGDATGIGIAGDAIMQGRLAAEQLNRRLSGTDPEGDKGTGLHAIDSEQVLLASKDTCAAAQPAKLSGEARLAADKGEITATITESQFLAEVDRCFSCGLCSGCEQCYMYCTSGCFTRLESPGPGRYFSLNLDSCKECGKCIEVCPGGFLEVIPAPA
jgi:formate dehydrogenase major subunit